MAQILSTLRAGRSLLPSFSASGTRGQVRLEELDKLKKFSDLIGTRTCDLPASKLPLTLHLFSILIHHPHVACVKILN
jgi:hypothetical protein